MAPFRAAAPPSPPPTPRRASAREFLLGFAAAALLLLLTLIGVRWPDQYRNESRLDVWSASDRSWSAGRTVPSAAFDFDEGLPPEATRPAPWGGRTYKIDISPDTSATLIQYGRHPERHELGRPPSAICGDEPSGHVFHDHLGSRWIVSILRCRTPSGEVRPQAFVVTEKAPPEWRPLAGAPEIAEHGAVVYFASPSVAFVLQNKFYGPSLRVDLEGATFQVLPSSTWAVGNPTAILGLDLLVFADDIPWHDVHSIDLRTGQGRDRGLEHMQSPRCDKIVALVPVPPGRVLRVCGKGEINLLDAATLETLSTATHPGQVVDTAWTADGRVFMETKANDLTATVLVARASGVAAALLLLGLLVHWGRAKRWVRLGGALAAFVGLPLVKWLAGAAFLVFVRILALFLPRIGG